MCRKPHARAMAPIDRSTEPNCNPIEQIFAKLKGQHRTAPARTVPDLWAAIRKAFARFTADECRPCLATASYDIDLSEGRRGNPG